MRVAQLTLNGYFNYGNILQKFALHHMLKKFADFAEVLWTDTNNFLPETGEKTQPQFENHENRPDCWHQYFMREAVRQNKFKNFENLHIRTRFDLSYLENLADEYDFFIIGADQVWNPFAPFPNKFLEFAPREKRITYVFNVNFARRNEVLPLEREKSFKFLSAALNVKQINNGVGGGHSCSGIIYRKSASPKFFEEAA